LRVAGQQALEAAQQEDGDGIEVVVGRRLEPVGQSRRLEEAVRIAAHARGLAGQADQPQAGTAIERQHLAGGGDSRGVVAAGRPRQDLHLEPDTDRLPPFERRL
jgi:hypothetical protein